MLAAAVTNVLVGSREACWLLWFCTLLGQSECSGIPVPCLAAVVHSKTARSWHFEELSQMWVTLCMPFLLFSLLLSWGVFQHESVYPPSLFPELLHMVICQEVVQACKATTSYPKMGLLSRSTNIHQQSPVEPDLVGWSLGRPMLELGALFQLCDICPWMSSLLFASQQPGFDHILALCWSYSYHCDFFP